MICAVFHGCDKVMEGENIHHKKVVTQYFCLLCSVDKKKGKKFVYKNRLLNEQCFFLKFFDLTVKAG